MKIAGIAPESEHATEPKDNMEKEQKMVWEALISAYDKNIAARLKAELCSLDANNYNYTKDASASKSLFFSLLILGKILIQYRVRLDG